MQYAILSVSTCTWAVYDYMGVTVRARMCEALLFFYRVKHLWRRALSALPMASPRRHSPPSAAAPPSKEWYLRSKRSVTASWISALLPDRIQMLLVKWHSYQVTSPIGEPFLYCKYFKNKLIKVMIWYKSYMVCEQSFQSLELVTTK